MKYKIKEVAPLIYHVEVAQAYDLAMLFLRYQEYYECSNPKFRGKSFTILDYMKWYTQTLGNGVFSYARDWTSFNVPSQVFVKLFELGVIIDHNKYDQVMFDIYQELMAKDTAENPFYVIGTSKENPGCLDHEIAHGLYKLNPFYKKNMKALTARISTQAHIELTAKLQHVGYADKVIDDEIQAYLATGLADFMDRIPIDPATIKEFEQVFESFRK